MPSIGKCFIKFINNLEDDFERGLYLVYYTHTHTHTHIYIYIYIYIYIW